MGDIVMGNRWELVLKIRGGHRYFREVVSGEPTERLAVADQSGKYPDDTDDGVLWVNRRKIREMGGLAISEQDGTARVSIPLIRSRDKRETSTVENLAGGVQLASLLMVPMTVAVDTFDQHGEFDEKVRMQLVVAMPIPV